MDQNYDIKYFIGIEFSINPTFHPAQLKKKYTEQINQMF